MLEANATCSVRQRKEETYGQHSMVTQIKERLSLNAYVRGSDFPNLCVLDFATLYDVLLASSVCDINALAIKFAMAGCKIFDALCWCLGCPVLWLCKNSLNARA